MKIAIIGAHGAGKTTLTYLLAAEAKKRGKNAKVVNELARKCVFPLNEGFSLDGAHWIITSQIREELNAKAANTDLIICDRSSIDPIMYLDAGDFIKKDYAALKHYAHSWMSTYDKIVFVWPGTCGILNDKVRAISPDFQSKVHDAFEDYIEEVGLKTRYISADSIFNSDSKTLYEAIL